MKKIPLDAILRALNSRTPREKILIIAMVFAIFISLDYLILAGPIVRLLMKNTATLTAQKQELRILREDRKNEAKIRQKWEETASRLSEEEKRFIAPNELPSLLENLSKLAQDSGVKIMTLKPLEVSGPSEAHYGRIPIKISAAAGTHEFGKFLAALEGGHTFFRVTNLKISRNSSSDRQHLLELNIETYRRPS